MLTLIAALAKNNCIGKNGKLPWNIPEDLQRFRDLTLGKTVLMGRKTWESIPEKFRPLPQRKNIVITRQPMYVAPSNVLVYSTIESAFMKHAGEDIMVIGGAEIYRQTIDKADILEITHVQESIDGDAFFPAIDPVLWNETEREDHLNFSFVTYTKI